MSTFPDNAESAILKAVRELKQMSSDPAFMKAHDRDMERQRALIAELQYAKQEGLEEGREVGIEQGIGRGQRQLLSRQLVRHLGEIPAAIAGRIEVLSLDALMDLGEAIFDLNSYAEVEKWLSARP